MKNYFSKALAALIIFGTTAQVHAYSYIFSNHTNKEVAVGMRFYGLGEPRYFRFIPSEQARQFTPSQATRTPEERPIESRKIGFIAKTWWYKVGPLTLAQKQDPKALNWTEFQITWMPTESYKLAIKLSQAITKISVAAGKAAIEAAIAVATEGSSIPMQAALKATNSGGTLDGLTALIKAAGQSASRSMMTDRHIDIVEDKEGIKFISQL